MGHSRPRTIQVPRPNVLPKCQLRRRRLRHNTSRTHHPFLTYHHQTSQILGTISSKSVPANKTPISPPSTKPKPGSKNSNAKQTKTSSSHSPATNPTSSPPNPTNAPSPPPTPKPTPEKPVCCSSKRAPRRRRMSENYSRLSQGNCLWSRREREG